MTNEDKDRLTNEEALKLLRQTPWLSSDEKIKLYPAIALAIKALEKRIPKKPKMKTTVEKQTKVWFCSCGAMFWGYKEKTPFCPHCGQALDWSEVGE